jgi:hypothetical protein
MQYSMCTGAKCTRTHARSSLCTLLGALITLMGVQVRGQIESSFAADPGAVIEGAPVDPAENTFEAPPNLPGAHARLPSFRIYQLLFYIFGFEVASARNSSGSLPLAGAFPAFLIFAPI